MLNSCRITMLLIIISMYSSVIAAENDKWQGYVEFLGKPGTARSLGQADLFVPIMQDNNSLTFFNLRGQMDDVDSDEFNVGVGFRRLYSDWILGGWGYLDHRNTSNGNTFLQGSIGFEALSNTWDYRVNGYIPEPDKKRVRGLDTIEITGSSIGIRIGQERALPGFDAEIGYKLPIFEDTRIYAGGYHFNANGFDNISGPRGRLEMRFHDLPFLTEGSRLMLGAEVTYDDVRGTQAFGLVQLRIPFGIVSGKKSRKLTPLERRMTDPVVKDIDIASSASLSDRIAARFSSGQVIDGIVTVDANDGDIAAEVADAGSNSIVIVDGTAGTVNTAGIAMQSGQTLTSGGMPMKLFFISDDSGGFESISYTPPGTRATINGTGADVITIFAGDDTLVTTIKDIDITGGTGHSIVGNDVGRESHLVIENSTISGSGARGILLGSDSILTVNNTQFSNTVGEAIATSGGSTIAINNSTFNNVGTGGQEAIQFGSKSIINMNNTTIDTVGTIGVKVTTNSIVTFNNVTIDNTGSDAIEVQNGNKFVISNSNIGTNGAIGTRGLDFFGNGEDGGNEVTITNTTINNTGDDGIRFNENNMARITGLTLTNVGNQGIDIDGENGNNDVSISDSTISNSASHGIEADNKNMITLNNVKISNAGSRGILIHNFNTGDFTNLTVDSSDTRGIQFDKDNRFSLTNVTISDTDNFEGLKVYDRNTLIINSLNVSGVVDGNALDFRDNNNITLNNSSISNVSGAGISFNDDNSATISGLTLTDTGQQGIHLGGENGNNDVSISDSTISNSASHGIELADSPDLVNANRLTLNNVKISNAGSRGILIQNFNTGDFTNLIVDSSNTRGIQFDNDNRFSLTNVTISNTDNFEGLKVYDRNTLIINSLNVSGVVNDDALDFRDNNDITLNNSSISNVSGAGNAIVIDDNNTLNGSGNTITAPIGGVACVDNGDGSNTGDFEFTDILGGGQGTCPP